MFRHGPRPPATILSLLYLVIITCMGIESAPKQKDAKQEEWEAIQRDIEDATNALNAKSDRLEGVAAVDAELTNLSVSNMTLQPIEEIEGYMKANDAALSKEQKNFLLSHLRAKRFKQENHS